MGLPTSITEIMALFKGLAQATAQQTAVALKFRETMLAQVTGMDELNQQVVLLNRGLSTQIGYNKTVSDQYVKLAAASLVFENRNKDLNKTFGITSTAAANLSTTLHTLAKEHKFSGEQAIKYAVGIKKMLPSFDQQSTKGAKTAESLQRIQHVLTTNLNLTAEATQAYSLYASKNGENADITLAFAASLSTALSDTDGTMGYMQQAIEGIAEASADTQLQFGKIKGNLEIATIKAKSLGFELDDLAAAGKSLLNIESSIGDELEYQLLSGHRLTDASGKSLTNAYREATLRGNMSDAASTLNTILENEGEVLENNLFAREKMAKLMNMDEASLSRALQKKKLLSSDDGLRVLMNLNGTELQTTAQAMLDNNQMSQKKFDEISKFTDTRTTDEIMKTQLDVAEESKDILSEMLTGKGPTGQANQVATTKAALTNKAGIDKFAKDVMLDLSEKELQTLGETENIADRYTKGNKLVTTTFKPGGIPSVGAGIDTPVKDAVIPAGYGSRILSFPEDSLQADLAFKNNDTIIAGTSLAGNGNASSATPGAATDATIMKMARMIVAAINGNNLFGGTSMNDSIYQT